MKLATPGTAPTIHILVYCINGATMIIRQQQNFRIRNARENDGSDCFFADNRLTALLGKLFCSITPAGVITS